MEPGKFYLCPLPFYWTVIGRYIRPDGMFHMLMDQVIYFRRPGATFDVLVSKGLPPKEGDSGALYHSFKSRQIRVRADSNLIIPWEDDNGKPQKTPWVKE